MKGKRKNRWKNSIAVKEEDQFKVTDFKILVCGVLTYYLWPPLLIQTDSFGLKNVVYIQECCE